MGMEVYEIGKRIMLDRLGCDTSTQILVIRVSVILL